MSDVEKTRLVLQVRPNAKHNRLIRFEGGVLHLAIAAPPREGKANRELIDFLSGALGLRKSDLTIETGLTSRRKIIAISRLTPDQMTNSIARLLGSAEGPGS